MSESDQTNPLVKQLLALLAGGQAHLTLDAAVEDFPRELHGKVPADLPYSAWQLLEHLRITQRDILDFSSPGAEGYKPIAWPREYWPKDAAPAAAQSWEATLAAIHQDAEAFRKLLSAPGVDLYTPLPWGEGQNLLREALLLTDHNSYHLGELVLLRRVLGAWNQ